MSSMRRGSAFFVCIVFVSIAGCETLNARKDWFWKNSPAVAKKKDASLARAELSYDVSQLGEKMETLQVTLDGLAQQIEKLKEQMQDVRSEVAKGRDDKKNLEAALDSQKKILQGITSEMEQRQSQGVIARARLLLEQKRFLEVVQLLDPLRTKSRPTDEGNDRLLLYLARGFFGVGNFEQAALIASEIENLHPGSGVVPEAILLQGQCFLRMRQPKDAKIFLQDVIQRFGRSSEARMARRLIKDNEHTQKPKRSKRFRG